MSLGTRQDGRKPIRDLGKRRIMCLNGHDSRAVSQPVQLRDTDFPSEVGNQVRILYDPNENEVTLRPVDED